MRVEPLVWDAMKSQKLRSETARDEAEFEREYQVAKASRKFGMRPADHLLPIMIDESGRSLTCLLYTSDAADE